MEPITGIPDGAKRKLEFGYDCTGRRIQKKSYLWVSGAWSLVSDIRFAYDGWNVLAELDSSLNPVRTYLWGLDLSESLQGAGGVGGLISVRYHGSGGAAYLALFDGNGNVSGLVTASTGALAATYEYGPFGEPIRLQGDQVNLTPFRWSTKYTDDESDLAYYGYRFYNPTTGSWPNRDPIEEKGGANIYGFVGNTPIARYDPTGLSADESNPLLVVKLFVKGVFSVGSAIRELWEGKEPAVSWSPTPCDPKNFTESGFIQVFRGGLGRFKGPGVDDGSFGSGTPPIAPPLYPVPPGDAFQDTPGGIGTGSLEFVVCQVCFQPCVGRCIPGRKVGSVGPCRRWKSGYKGSLDDSEALKAGTIEAMASPPDWFKSTVENAFPGSLGGSCRDMSK